MTDQRVAELRREYEAQGLVEDAMADDPMTQFQEWFDGVVDAGVEEPNAFVLATSGPDGRPSARAVLMKEVDPGGIVFYTGLSSRKSDEIRANPYAAGTFVWIPLHRQVRFEGPVSAVAPAVADAYFATRPRGAQIAAHASHQSSPVPSRRFLDDRFDQLEASFGDSVVPRPESWGGWRIEPDRVEFWQGQPNRFHDRIVYTRSESGWVRQRLAP